jgi:hypothetical protein
LKTSLITTPNSLCRPFGLAGAFLFVMLLPVNAYADSWQVFLFEPKNLWLIPAIIAIEYPLAHFLTNGDVLKSLAVVCVMNALSGITDGFVQMTIIQYVGGLDYWMVIAASWTVITAIETIVLLMRQTKGVGLVMTFVLTGLVNAVTMWLVFKYTLN